MTRMFPGVSYEKNNLTNINLPKDLVEVIAKQRNSGFSLNKGILACKAP